MDPRGLTWLTLFLPQDKLEYRIPDWFHPFQMTCLACHHRMNIMGNLLIMGKMALLTVSQPLISVVELR